MEKGNLPSSEKRRVTIRTAAYNTNQKWTQEFNAATFMNYDPNNQVKITNDIVIPPAQTISGKVYPTIFKIGLNTGEINSRASYFNLDFGGSSSANLVIVTAEYNDGL